MKSSCAEYQENGFVLLKNFFSKDQIENVFEDARRIFVAQMLHHQLVSTPHPRGSEFEEGMYQLFERHPEHFMNCGKQAQHLISLHRLSLEPLIQSKLQDLGMTFPNISTRPVMYFNHPRLAKKEVYWRVFPHQDWRSMQGSLDSIVVWMPMVDIDVSLGALEIVPRSHHEGLLTTEVEDGFGKVQRYVDADFVPVETERGDALFFSSFLVHRSGNNVTPSIRWSCHFRYNNLDEPTFIERGFPHPYLYKPQEQLITPRFSVS